MTADMIKALADAFVEASLMNKVAREKAFRPELAGMRIYDAPLIGYAAADDDAFAALRAPQVRMEGFMMPCQWLEPARTVISLFLPFTQRVRDSNRKNRAWPSKEWLHARIEGQAMLVALLGHLQAALEAAGHACVIPVCDSRFWSVTNPPAPGQEGFTSNWSERHVAYVCGLGTFSLSKGLITEKGTAGRFGSLVTDLALPPSVRPYDVFDAYCSKCGACAKSCPAGAISVTQGKDHALCSAYLDQTRAIRKPYYGCGKCQTGMPCEAAIPKARRG